VLAWLPVFNSRCLLYCACVSQVIEDTASVVQHVRKERGVPSAVPNIVIGGSYGV
jgi:hypothetical protein